MRSYGIKWKHRDRTGISMRRSFDGTWIKFRHRVTPPCVSARLPRSHAMSRPPTHITCLRKTERRCNDLHKRALTIYEKPRVKLVCQDVRNLPVSMSTPVTFFMLLIGSGFTVGPTTHSFLHHHHVRMKPQSTSSAAQPVQPVETYSEALQRREKGSHGWQAATDT